MSKRKPRPRGNQYRKRAKNVVTLGFRDYAEYLQSELWREIRLRVLQRDKFVCKRCKGRATQVHHRKYVMKALTGENIGLLVSLCAECHRFCEWDGDRKTMPSGANGRIKLTTSKLYIQSIAGGPCLASTVHNSILEGYAPSEFDQKRMDLWSKLKTELGEEEAKEKVRIWIASPRKIK